ncbi:MAG TPA: hypothetical protein DD381_06165 [Lentisphaeria bacterium]|nr:MAG: hypothetical protein A2X47_05250 [Lentisphaerae bacterium GWF2_38_69]HBM15911.1 hypothetical protein [Lentisphaeria bacterium]
MLNSDFIVADLGVYNPLSDPVSFNAGWLFNDNSYQNWFTFLSQLNKEYKLPIMLYQVSGGALPTSKISSITDQDTPYNTLPNYIFGNYCPDAGTPYLSSDILHNTEMPEIYLDFKGVTLENFLKNNTGKMTNNYDWTLPHLDTLKDIGVFAICWGGSAGTWQMPGVSPYFLENGQSTKWIKGSDWLNQNVTAYRNAATVSK